MTEFTKTARLIATLNRDRLSRIDTRRVQNRRARCGSCDRDDADVVTDNAMSRAVYAICADIDAGPDGQVYVGAGDRAPRHASVKRARCAQISVLVGPGNLDLRQLCSARRRVEPDLALGQPERQRVAFTQRAVGHLLTTHHYTRVRGSSEG